MRRARDCRAQIHNACVPLSMSMAIIDSSRTNSAPSAPTPLRMGGALCRPLQGADVAIRAGNHGVSDPGARARNGPAPVRRGRSRHGCGAFVGVRRAVPASRERRVSRNDVRGEIVAQIVRTIRSRPSWKCWSPKATLWRQVARLTSQPDLVRARVAFQVHFRPREVTTQVTTCDTPAITRSMLDLCRIYRGPPASWRHIGDGGS